MMSGWTKNLRSATLIASMLAALLAGTAVATAQPGAEFQNQGIREDNGLPRFGELRVRRLPRPAHVIFGRWPSATHRSSRHPRHR